MDEPEFVCNYDGHDEEEIIGYCLNKDCQHNAQFCLKCCWDKHGDHEEDCKTFKQIQKLLQTNKQQQTGQSDEVNNKLKSIQSKCEQLCQKKNIGYEKLDEIENNLKEKEYQNCLADIQFLKNIHNPNQSNQKLILEQLDNILQALNTLGILQIPKVLTSQSQNTDSILKVQMKDQGIQVIIEEQNQSGQVIKKEEVNLLNKQQDEVPINKSCLKSKVPQEKSVKFSQENQQQTQPNKDQNPIFQTPKDPLSNSYQQTLQQFYQESTPLKTNQQSASNIYNPVNQNVISEQQKLNTPITQVPQIPTNQQQIISQQTPQSSQQNMEQRQIQQMMQQQSNDSQSEIIKQKFEEQVQREINKKPEYKNNPQPQIKLTDQEWEQYKKVITSAQDQNQNFVIDTEVTTYYDDDHQQQLDEYDKFLEKDPLNIEKLVLKCKTLIMSRKNKEALECSEFIRDIEPYNFQPYILIGLALNQLKKFEEALHNYCISIQIEPSYEAYLLQGVALMAINQYDDAIESIENSIRMRPQLEDGYYQMGLALIKKQKYQQAIKYFEITLRISPKHSQALQQKNLCLQQLQELQGAIKDSDDANQRDQREETVYFNKGLELFKAQNYKQALHQFEKAISINYQMHEAHAYRGETLNNLGRLLDSIKSFDEALKLAPNPSYMIKKADTLKEMNNNEEAQLLYQKAQQIISKEKQNPQKN